MKNLLKKYIDITNLAIHTPNYALKFLLEIASAVTFNKQVSDIFTHLLKDVDKQQGNNTARKFFQNFLATQQTSIIPENKKILEDACKISPPTILTQFNAMIDKFNTLSLQSATAPDI